MELLSDNFYEKPTPKQEKELQNEENARLKEIGMTADLAKACLNTEVFAKYKRQYQLLEKRTVNSMINFTRRYFAKESISPEEYAMVMLRYTVQLSSFRLLIDQVEAQANS